jgi:multidrug resistance efflux pump
VGLARRPIRALLPWVAGLLALIVVAHLIRTPATIDAHARYVSAARSAVRAEEPGRVAAVLVQEGDWILPGRVVAVLENDSLVAAWREAKGRSDERAIDLARSLEASDPAGYQTASLRRSGSHAEEAALRSTRARLALAAAEGGVVVTPRPAELVGARLEAGDTLLVVARDGRSEVECDLREVDLGDIEPGQRFTLRLRSRPGRALTGTVERIFSLAAETPGAATRFKVWGRLDAAPHDIRLGESGIARIEVGRWNLYERVGREWSRLVRADFWL